MRFLRVSGFFLAMSMVMGLLVCPLSAHADSTQFSIKSAHTYRVYSVYYLDATAALPLNDTLRNALKNGISVMLSFDIHVDQKGGWWFDDTVATLSQRYLLRYHALSRRYLVDNLNTGITKSFLLLGEALADISHLRRLPLLDKMLLSNGHEYQVDLRVRVDTSEYPLPLRVRAFIEGAWRPSSDWYRCPLK